MTQIEFLRREKGLSQLELGRQLGINATSIVQTEKGYRKPWPKLRKQLAEQLGVEQQELFDAQGWPLPLATFRS